MTYHFFQVDMTFSGDTVANIYQEAGKKLCSMKGDQKINRAIVCGIAENIQEELYEQNGQDGDFQVVHCSVPNMEQIFAIVIFKIDDSEYENDDTPEKLLKMTIEDTWGDECIFEITRIFC